MSKRLLLIALVFGLIPSGLLAAELHPGLVERMDQARAGEQLPVILRLQDRLDPGLYRGADRASSLIRDLRGHAESSQAALLERLGDWELDEEPIRLWIDNSIAAKLGLEQIQALREFPGLARIDYDEPVLGEFGAQDGGRAPVWSQALIGADQVWSDYGLDGSGVVVGSMDTGAEVSHPALAGKWRGGGNSWLDLVNGNPSPYDDHGHGTHTIGTMVGGDGLGAFNTDIGTAPGAEFISVKVLDHNNSFSSASIVINGAQWILDPDGDPGTDDFPRIVCNSWYFFSQTYDGFHASVDAWRTAGILPVFCQGNSGPNPATTHPPGNYDNTLGVGASNSSDLIWSFSSRGPSPAGPVFPADQRKPDISAPGQLVLSAIPGGNYASWSGTSMATPHVSGVAALMLEANPALSIEEIEQALLDTSVDLGTPGYDHDFGHGRLDAYAAVTAILDPTAAPALPLSGARLQAAVNPFRGRVRLDYASDRGSAGELAIFDIGGRRVREMVASGESGSMIWDGRDGAGRSLPAGLYLARLSTEGGSAASCRLLLLR